MSVTDDAIDAINRARLDLSECGTPAYTVVTLLPDGEDVVAEFTYSGLEPARALAVRLCTDQPGARIYLVGRHGGGCQVRFTVHEPGEMRMVHRQDEILEPPIGHSLDMLL